MDQEDKSAKKQTPPEQFSAYVVIPSSVFFDHSLSDKAKLLYGLLSCMCNHRGYCWAKNDTLCRFLGTESDGTLRRHLRELKAAGHIVVETDNESGAVARKIFVTAVSEEVSFTHPVKNDRPRGQNQPPHPVKNDRHNNNNLIIPPIAPQGAAHDAQKKVRKKPTGEVTLTPELEESFSRFWSAYPVHKDKQRARYRWQQLSPDEALVVSILDSIDRLKQTDAWQRDIVPLPSTFLNNRRWEDAEDLPEPTEGGKTRWL